MFKRAKGIVLLGKASLGTSPNAQHNLGWYATPEALQTAHPTGDDGDWAMVGSTDTVWIWDSDTSAWVDSGNTNSANTNLDNLTSTGKANISAQGTYDSGATYNAGTVGKAIQGKANVDMDDLTSVGANIANWSSNVSNCILEIPQDINLELSSGTLTLKAGSKVYVPNGFEQDGTTKKFDVVTVAADKTLTSAATWSFLVFYNKTDGSFKRCRNMLNQVSGNTAPATPEEDMFWYDTTNNLVKRYDGSDWVSDYSLPIGLITANGSIKSIDQVFNGFGYIGSKVFVLPGVKGLAPDGRNSDGTLKNTIVQVSTVYTVDCFESAYFVGNNYIGPANDRRYTEQEEMPNWDYGIWYKPSENIMYFVNNYVPQKLNNRAKCCYVSVYGGKVSKMDVYQTFRAVDYNDTEFIAHQAMLSSVYTDLTLPTSGQTVTAPADGYITVNKAAAASGEYINMINNSNNANVNSIATGAMNCRLLMPVSKGDVVTINYTVAGTTNWFRFIYANGAK